jgi:hypothetical protein
LSALSEGRLSIEVGAVHVDPKKTARPVAEGVELDVARMSIHFTLTPRFGYRVDTEVSRGREPTSVLEEYTSDGTTSLTTSTVDKIGERIKTPTE